MKTIFTYTLKNTTVLLYSILLAILIMPLIISCSKNEETINNGEYAKLLQQSSSASVSTHRWFYFTEDGFKETDIPRNAPDVEPKPWTNALRISSSAFIEGKAYFAVNRLGIIEAPPTFGIQKSGIASETKLIKDIDLFSNASVGDIFCIEGVPVLNFFTNSIFESEETEKNSPNIEEPFLVAFNTEDYTFTPLLSKKNLSQNLAFESSSENIPNFLETEIREVNLYNNTWNILLKSSNVGRTDFYALSFKTDKPITEDAVQILIGEMHSIDEYRRFTRPQEISELPRKIQNLLEPVPQYVSYYLHHNEENIPSQKQYEHVSSSSKQIQGYSLSLDTCSLAIFEDGTICFAGSLPSKGVVNNGITKAFKLPDLGPGYIYGAMALSGSTLLIAWEETSFFETRRSGFLAVDMEQVLYESNR